MKKKMNDDKPAILGGIPTFSSLVPIIRPTLPSIEDIQQDIEEILSTQMITNHKYVQKLEEELKKYIGVRNVVALSNCTTGLMLLGKCLNLEGEVITPSFSFSATSLALIWLGLKPIFIDVDLNKFTIDPEKVKEKISSKTSAILATHIFGNPCDINALENLAEDYKLKLIFDSAHGAGSIYRGKKVGNFGAGESFSMSPTKVLTAGEGGLIATTNNKLADCIKIGRNYANPGDYNTAFIGLSGRMAEFSAILALKSLEILEKNVLKRQELVSSYKSRLNKLPGISFQKIEENSRSSYKDFAIIIDPIEFELTRDKLFESLNAENIMTKKYFAPPIHQQDAFKPFLKDQNLDLSETNKLAENILCLPIYSHMEFTLIDKICNVIERIYNNRNEIKSD
jgi:dTDP-4-amino-4,6-dideoxygalactose transaminase